MVGNSGTFVPRRTERWYAVTKQLRIDFVSDVSCPWCAVGLKSLEQALLNVGDDVRVDLHFQPFELNPNMPPEGQDIVEHVTEKYGASLEQQASSRDMILIRFSRPWKGLRGWRWLRTFRSERFCRAVSTRRPSWP